MLQRFFLCVSSPISSAEHLANRVDFVRVLTLLKYHRLCCAGMYQLEGREFTITDKGPFSFEIDCDTSTFSTLVSGYVNQVRGVRRRGAFRQFLFVETVTEHKLIVFHMLQYFRL